MLISRIARLNWGIIIPLIYFAVVVVFLFLTRKIYVLNLDEGMLWSSAMKVADGQVMYRDFFEFWTPGSVYILGGLFKLFGAHMWMSKLAYITSSLTCYYLLYNSLRSARVGIFSSLVAVSTLVFTGISFLTLNHHWFGIACMLATLVMLQKHFSSPDASRKYIFLAGVMAGVTAAIMQYEGVMAISAGVASIMLLSPSGYKLKNVSLFLLPIVIVGIIIVAIFASAHAIVQLLYNTVIFPLLQYRQTNYGLPFTITHWHSSILFFISMWYLRHRIQKNKPLFTYTIFALSTWFFSLFTSFSMLHAYAFSCLINGTIVLMIASFIKDKFVLYTKSNTLGGYLGNASQLISTRNGVIAATYTAITFLVIFNVYRGLYELGPRITHNFYSERVTINVPAGEIRVNPKVANRINAIAQTLKLDDAQRGETYFGPYSSYYNFLLHLQNPLPYSQLTPNYNPDWMFQDAVAEIEKSKPEYIVWLPRESFFPSGYHNQFFQYLSQNYDIAKDLGEVYATHSRDLSHEPPDAIWRRQQSSK